MQITQRYTTSDVTLHNELSYYCINYHDCGLTFDQRSEYLRIRATQDIKGDLSKLFNKVFCSCNRTFKTHYAV